MPSCRPPQCLHAKGFVCLILVSQSSDQGHAAVPGSCKAEYACRANDTTAFVREECKIMQSVVQCYLSVTTAVCYMLQCPILPEILDHSNAPRVRFEISMLCESLNLRLPPRYKSSYSYKEASATSVAMVQGVKQRANSKANNKLSMRLIRMELKTITSALVQIEV